MNVSRSGYYQWTKRPESERKQRHSELEQQINGELEQQISRIFVDSRRLYSSPNDVPRQQGVRVSRFMKELGLKSRTVKKYKAATNSNHKLPVHDNALNRQFRSQAPNQVWMTDITYVPTDKGWLYVASVMDLYARKIVGWHADEQMSKKLVLQALDQAYNRQRPKDGVLQHSDRGSQYASHEYPNRPLKYGLFNTNKCTIKLHNFLNSGCLIY